MESLLKTYTYENGEIQRIHAVYADSFEHLGFVRPRTTPEAIRHIASIYRDFFVARVPFLFGKLYVFYLPDGLELPFPTDGLGSRELAAVRFLKKNHRKPEGKAFLAQLEELGCLDTVRGKNPFAVKFMPYDRIGFPSGEKGEAIINASFFMFDLFDVDSPYDVYGTPLGLCVEGGRVLCPPLFHREALLVRRDGSVTVRKAELSELDTGIPGEIYERPDRRRTPRNNKTDVVIVGDRIVAVRPGGGTRIPSSGFVISTERTDLRPGDPVVYRGMEDVLFGVQVGSSATVNGEKTLDFKVPYYHLFKPGEVQTPPSNYPKKYAKDRAPRSAIGATADGRPVLLWAEGKPKTGYEPGRDSCGATLYEMALIAEDLGLPNCVNLDGGGSSQLLVDGVRSLLISDRNFSDNSESERPVPTCIVLR